MLLNPKNWKKIGGIVREQCEASLSREVNGMSSKCMDAFIGLTLRP